MIIYAPNDFPKEDYLPEEKQLNLERAYEELRNGVGFVEERIKDESVVQYIKSSLLESKRLFEEDNEKGGTKIIQELRAALQKYR